MIDVRFDFSDLRCQFIRIILQALRSQTIPFGVVLECSFIFFEIMVRASESEIEWSNVSHIDRKVYRSLHP